MSHKAPGCPYLGTCASYDPYKCSRRERCTATAAALKIAGDQVHSVAGRARRLEAFGKAGDAPPGDDRDPRLGLAIVLASAMVAIGLAWFAYARWLDRPAPPPPAAVTQSCAAPTREGSRLVITVTLERGALTIACRQIGDWRNP